MQIRKRDSSRLLVPLAASHSFWAPAALWPKRHYPYSIRICRCKLHADQTSGQARSARLDLRSAATRDHRYMACTEVSR